MDKIFDSEVEKYLKESGVSEKEINKIKHKKYKENMLIVANKLVEAIEKDEFNLIKHYRDESPAGDDMGINSSLLNFHFINKPEDHYLVDIKDAFRCLVDYKEKSE